MIIDENTYGGNNTIVLPATPFAAIIGMCVIERVATFCRCHKFFKVLLNDEFSRKFTSCLYGALMQNHLKKQGLFSVIRLTRDVTTSSATAMPAVTVA